jgi:GntR family transcriptional repressor for pyruvate dehydrogenase complex
MRPLKIETQKGHEKVAEHILTQIKSGELVPGQKLPSVVDLATVFGVGRSTIREAVSALKAMGWLDVRHGGGTYVQAVLPSATPSSTPGNLFEGAESIREILDVRKILERGTATLAAQHRTDVQLLRLRQILADMEHSMVNGDIAAGERADVEFHVGIAVASGNSLLIELMGSLTQRMTETIRKTRELWFYEQKATAERLLDEHKSIYDAIAERDSLKASSLIEAHLTKVENVLKLALPE